MERSNSKQQAEDAAKRSIPAQDYLKRCAVHLVGEGQ